jgi:hypothetical protein
MEDARSWPVKRGLGAAHRRLDASGTKPIEPAAGAEPEADCGCHLARAQYVRLCNVNAQQPSRTEAWPQPSLGHAAAPSGAWMYARFPGPYSEAT